MAIKLEKTEYIFVLLIPIINALATITVNYFPSSTLNPGTIRAMIVGLFVLYFIINRLPLNMMTKFLFIYLLYFGLLAYFTSNPSKTLYEYSKFLLSAILLPVGYVYINDKTKLKHLSRIYVIVLLIFLSDIFLANFLGYGQTAYVEDSIHFGSSKVNITKAMIILIFTMPIAFLLEKKQHRNILGVILFFGLLMTLVGIKRSVLLSAAAGFLIYLFLSPFKVKLIKFSILGGILLVTIFSFFIDLFFDRFYARGERTQITEETLETEGRYLEAFRVWAAWEEGDLKHKLIGSEFFNDRHFFNSSRMLHTDYMILLAGSGLIGVFLWFSLFYLLNYFKNKAYLYLKNDRFFRELNAVFWMLIVAQLLISISGTIYSINVRSLLFLYWGAIIGTMRNEAIKVIHSMNDIKE
jgi:hypothetical protein